MKNRQSHSSLTITIDLEPDNRWQWRIIDHDDPTNWTKAKRGGYRSILDAAIHAKEALEVFQAKQAREGKQAIASRVDCYV